MIYTFIIQRTYNTENPPTRGQERIGSRCESHGHGHGQGYGGHEYFEANEGGGDCYLPSGHKGGRRYGYLHYDEHESQQSQQDHHHIHDRAQGPMRPVTHPVSHEGGEVWTSRHVGYGSHDASGDRYVDWGGGGSAPNDDWGDDVGARYDDQGNVRNPYYDDRTDDAGVGAQHDDQGYAHTPDNGQGNAGTLHYDGQGNAGARYDGHTAGTNDNKGDLRVGFGLGRADWVCVCGVLVSGCSSACEVCGERKPDGRADWADDEVDGLLG